MKKVILTAVTIFTFGFANAQEVKFGVKAGLNLSTISGGSDMKTGFHLGGLAEIKFNDKVALQPELMYSMEGGEYAYDAVLMSTFYEFNQEIKLNKIIMPIMFKYFVIPNLSIEVGPQVDYIVSNNSEASLTVPGSLKFTEDTDMGNNPTTIVLSTPSGAFDSGFNTHDFGFKKLNFGVNFGAGYQLASGLFFQGRYNLGLTEFTDNSNFMGSSIEGNTPLDITKSGNAFKSSNIQISLGYKF